MAFEKPRKLERVQRGQSSPVSSIPPASLICVLSSSLQQGSPHCSDVTAQRSLLARPQGKGEPWGWCWACIFTCEIPVLPEFPGLRSPFLRWGFELELAE